MSHVAWTDIEGLHNVRKAVAKYPHLLSGSSTVTYRAKVKLHGTNAGVKVTPAGKVMAMSRSKIISPTDDNVGFAAWVEKNNDLFASWASIMGDTIVYGEWCGPGIMKGVAVNGIPNKCFCPFAVRGMWGEGDSLFVDPAEMNIPRTFDIQHIPWFNEGETFVIDWSLSAEELQPVVERINACVDAVEACDPFVKDVWNVEGTGEGLVFYPVSGQHRGYNAFSNLSFKAKGKKHQVAAHKKPASVDAEVVAGLAAFANLAITDARCEQGAREVSGGELSCEMRLMGPFLKWISDDVKKEMQAELEASGLDPKQVNKAAMEKARGWYMERAKRL